MTPTQAKRRNGASAERVAPRSTEPRVFTGIGYLLLIVGFIVTLVPGWVVFGSLAIWVGCGLGLNGSQVVRWLGGLAIGVTLAFLGAGIATIGGRFVRGGHRPRTARSRF